MRKWSLTTATSFLTKYSLQRQLMLHFNALLGPPVAITQHARGPYVLLLFISFVCHEISAVSRPIAAKLCHTIGNGCSFKNWVQNLGVLPQKIWGGKHAFFGAVSDDFALRSRISPERNKISTIENSVAKLRSLSRLLT